LRLLYTSSPPRTRTAHTARDEGALTAVLSIAQVTWQETDGPRALAVLAKSKQSLFQLLQLKDKQSQDGEEIVRALQTKREESRLLDEGARSSFQSANDLSASPFSLFAEFQGKWAEYWASGDQIGLERLEDKMKVRVAHARARPLEAHVECSRRKVVWCAQRRGAYGACTSAMPSPCPCTGATMCRP
jgi:hypothetical protein